MKPPQTSVHRRYNSHKFHSFLNKLCVYKHLLNIFFNSFLAITRLPLKVSQIPRRAFSKLAALSFFNYVEWRWTLLVHTRISCRETRAKSRDDYKMRIRRRFEEENVFLSRHEEEIFFRLSDVESDGEKKKKTFEIDWNFNPIVSCCNDCVLMAENRTRLERLLLFIWFIWVHEGF